MKWLIFCVSATAVGSSEQQIRVTSILVSYCCCYFCSNNVTIMSYLVAGVCLFASSGIICYHERLRARVYFKDCLDSTKPCFSPSVFIPSLSSLLKSSHMVWESAVSFPSGVWGREPADIGFWRILAFKCDILWKQL